MAYRPLNDCVLLEPEPDLDYAQIRGIKGLVLPDAYKMGPIDMPRWGKVIAKGPDCKDSQVAVGSRVLYAKFGWSKVQIEGDIFLVLVREYDLLALDDGR